MIKYFIGLVTILLTACSSIPDKAYYQLPDVYQPIATEQVVAVKSERQPQIWIQPIRLSDMLISSGIVYQTSDINYTVANQHLWINPLDQQLQQSLMKGLANAFPTRVVSTQPIEDKLAKLAVTVNYFQGRYDGQVIIGGDWIYTEGETVISQPFSVQLTQEEDGYPALVRTLGVGWQQVVAQIAETISKQN